MLRCDQKLVRKSQSIDSIRVESSWLEFLFLARLAIAQYIFCYLSTDAVVTNLRSVHHRHELAAKQNSEASRRWVIVSLSAVDIYGVDPAALFIATLHL